MKTILITGSDHGLGRELVKLFQRDRRTWDVLQLDHANCDLRNPQAIRVFCQELAGHPLDILVNCAGLNRISYIEHLNLADWEDVMNVNARAPYLLVKNLLQNLSAVEGTVCNIVSNASHVPMTASLAYNASKGALHIMTLQMARELTKRFSITVFGVSPNKMSGTYMSQYIDSHVPEVRGWTPAQAAAYQKAALLTGEETPVREVADFLYYVLTHDHRHLSGCIIPYGA